jgi:hypothetical protein
MIFHNDILTDTDAFVADACDYLDRWVKSVQSSTDAPMDMLPSSIEKLIEELFEHTNHLFSMRSQLPPRTCCAAPQARCSSVQPIASH